METRDFRELIIKDIVSENFKYAEVFETKGIDFCCKGNRKLSDACLEKEIDIVELNNELNKVTGFKGNNGFADWELDFLIDFIINNHHKYVQTATAAIQMHLEKVAWKHGEKHPELAEVKSLFLELSNELLSHMQKEEVVLFPAIKNIVAAEKRILSIEKRIMNVAHPIAVMESEHSNAGTILEKLRELTNNYKIPEDACTTYSVTYKELEEFEMDLHKHIFLENSILFPKAIKLYNKLIN